MSCWESPLPWACCDGATYAYACTDQPPARCTTCCQQKHLWSSLAHCKITLDIPSQPRHPHPLLPVMFVCRGNTNASLLETEEAGYIYRYQYNGVGEGVTWLSSRNYMVIDLAAGPTTYGPLVRQGGAATPQGIPSVKVRLSALEWSFSMRILHSSR